MAKKKSKTLEEMFPDAEVRERIQQQLYSGGPLFGEGSIFSEMLQAMINATLDGEMRHFQEEQKASGEDNRRNGYTSKEVRSTAGKLEVHTPRDRKADFEPLLIGKRQRSLPSGMEDIILGLYARGNSVEDIRYQLQELYGVELSTGLISTITEGVQQEALAWQQRPLAGCYAVVYLDALRFKVRREGSFENRSVHSVYGIDAQGQRDVLGLYLFDHEGAGNWALVLEDVQRRGVETVLFFCVDGLEGFSEAIEGVFPQAIVQRCIVHMVRSSTKLVADKDMKNLCADLRKIYTAANEIQAQMALDAFGRKWDDRYPSIRPKWQAAWGELMAFLAFGPQIRRMIYTTNPIEALHRLLRKVTKAKGAWVSDRALFKQLYLALMHHEKSWKHSAYNWKPVQKELIDRFGLAYEKYLES